MTDHPPSLPVPSPWWHRAGALLRDLVAFDVGRLDALLATRTLLALFVPLLGFELLGWHDLVVIGIAAFLVCIGDCVEDGDRGQAHRLLVGLALGSLAFGSGVLLGDHLITAIAGMIVWGVLCGLMGLWGPAYAAMSMPVIWAYVELGLPAPEHGVLHAAKMAALFAVGGAFGMALTFAFARLFPLHHARRLTACCFQALAAYVSQNPHQGHVSAETQVRAAIARARHAIRNARPAGSIDARLRLVLLTEEADQLFSRISAARESAPLATSRLKEPLLRLARRIGGRQGNPVPAETDSASEINARLERAHALMEGPIPDTGRFKQEILEADAPPRLLLREALTLKSLALRHALRFAAVMSVAVLIFWLLPRPFGFWVPLTVTVVLKPYAGMTLARALQRVAGTTGGILLAMAAMPLLSTPALQLGFVFAAFFAMMMVLPFNYSLAVFFLSAGVVPYEHILMPDLRLDVAGLRLLATWAGAALALVGGHLLWPDFEHRALPDLIARARRSMAAYARAVLSGEQRAIPPAHRATGLDITNLQTALQRAMTEIGGDRHGLILRAEASAALQSLFIALNSARLTENLATPEGFADTFADMLASPQAGGADRCRSHLETGQPPVLRELCSDLARLEQACLQEASTPPAAAQPVANEA